jgi:hypothetical protein
MIDPGMHHFVKIVANYYAYCQEDRWSPDT